VNATAEILLNYINNAIFDPINATLDLEQLPEDFQEFGRELCYFVEFVLGAKAFAQALLEGSQSEKALSLEEREEREEIEERLRLQQYINLLHVNTPHILLVFDTEGKAVLASEAYKQSRIALSEEEIIGKTFAELFSPISTEEFIEHMDKMLRDALVDGQSGKIEQDMDFRQEGEKGDKEKKGEKRSYIIRVTPMLDENKVIVGVIIIFFKFGDSGANRKEYWRGG